MTMYDILLERAYDAYVENWCRQRGYRRSAVNPELGINGECYVCKDEFADCEFADPDIARQYLSAIDFEQYKKIMEDCI